MRCSDLNLLTVSADVAVAFLRAPRFTPVG